MTGQRVAEPGLPAEARHVLVVGGAKGAADRLVRHLVTEAAACVAWAPWAWEAEVPEFQAGVQPLPAPVLDEEGVDALVAAAETALGTIDAVVIDASGPSEACRASATVAVADLSLECWRQGLERQLVAPFLVVQRVVETFLSAGTPGRIVLLTGCDGAGVELAAARTALHSFTRSVAREYGRRRIACNAVDLPGGDRSCDAWLPVAVFLASPEAAYVSGDVVAVAPQVPDPILTEEMSHGF